MNETVQDAQVVSVGGVSLEVVTKGRGQPVLLLHGADGPTTKFPYFDMLARHAQVIAPTLPGFDGSPLPDWIDNVDDLAYLYLDFLRQKNLRDVTVLGFSLGGWIAAEMVVRCSHSISHLVLAGAVGIKISDRETRDIPDIYAMHPEQVLQLIYHKRDLAPNAENLSDDELMRIARHREAAVLYLWEPYMHNPKLRRRLQRVDVPVLYVRGSHDGLISAKYAEAYCAAMPRAQLVTIDDAGHLPEREQPQVFVDTVAAFIRGPSSRHA